MTQRRSHGRPGVGDEVEAGDDLRPGDIVYFDHAAPHRIVIRAMTQDVLRRHDGPIFLVVAGDAPGQLGFHEVSRHDVE